MDFAGIRACHEWRSRYFRGRHGAVVSAWRWRCSPTFHARQKKMARARVHTRWRIAASSDPRPNPTRGLIRPAASSDPRPRPTSLEKYAGCPARAATGRSRPRLKAEFAHSNAETLRLRMNVPSAACFQAPHRQPQATADQARLHDDVRRSRRFGHAMTNE